MDDRLGMGIGQKYHTYVSGGRMKNGGFLGKKVRYIYLNGAQIYACFEPPLITAVAFTHTHNPDPEDAEGIEALSDPDATDEELKNWVAKIVIPAKNTNLNNIKLWWKQEGPDGDAGSKGYAQFRKDGSLYSTSAGVTFEEKDPEITVTPPLSEILITYPSLEDIVQGEEFLFSAQLMLEANDEKMEQPLTIDFYRQENKIEAYTYSVVNPDVPFIPVTGGMIYPTTTAEQIFTYTSTFEKSIEYTGQIVYTHNYAADVLARDSWFYDYEGYDVPSNAHNLNPVDHWFEAYIMENGNEYPCPGWTYRQQPADDYVIVEEISNSRKNEIEEYSVISKSLTGSSASIGSYDCIVVANYKHTYTYDGKIQWDSDGAIETRYDLEYEDTKEHMKVLDASLFSAENEINCTVSFSSADSSVLATPSMVSAGSYSADIYFMDEFIGMIDVNYN